MNTSSSITRNICVFCGSSSGSDPAFRSTALDLGVALADGGHQLVYGGGDVGLMGVVANAVMNNGGAEVAAMATASVTLEVR